MDKHDISLNPGRARLFSCPLSPSLLLFRTTGSHSLTNKLVCLNLSDVF